MKTAVAAPAPRPSDDEMFDAIAQLTLLELLKLRMKLQMLLIRRIAEQAGL